MLPSLSPPSKGLLSIFFSSSPLPSPPPGGLGGSRPIRNTSPFLGLHARADLLHAKNADSVQAKKKLHGKGTTRNKQHPNGLTSRQLHQIGPLGQFGEEKKLSCACTFVGCCSLLARPSLLRSAPASPWPQSLQAHSWDRSSGVQEIRRSGADRSSAMEFMPSSPTFKRFRRKLTVLVRNFGKILYSGDTVVKATKQPALVLYMTAATFG